MCTCTCTCTPMFWIKRYSVVELKPSMSHFKSINCFYPKTFYNVPKSYAFSGHAAFGDLKIIYTKNVHVYVILCLNKLNNRNMKSILEGDFTFNQYMYLNRAIQISPFIFKHYFKTSLTMKMAHFKWLNLTNEKFILPPLNSYNISIYKKNSIPHSCHLWGENKCQPRRIICSHFML